MSHVPQLAELQDRVRESIAAHGGTMPPDLALVWDGYFAALLEWGLISVSDHKALVDMLPDVPNKPVLEIFLGSGSDPEHPAGRTP
jgi:hypothetical protein